MGVSVLLRLFISSKVCKSLQTYIYKLKFMSLKNISAKMANVELLCFRFDALTELGAFMRTELLCISVLRVASGPRVKLASCKSALNPPVVCSTDRSKAVVPVLVFDALWFILRGDLLYVFPCVILFL